MIIIIELAIYFKAMAMRIVISMVNVLGMTWKIAFGISAIP